MNTVGMNTVGMNTVGTLTPDLSCLCQCVSPWGSRG